MADLGLVTVTLFWGSTFILSKLVLEQIPLGTYLVIRLNFAAIFMSIFAFRYWKSITRQTLIHGIILGVFLFFSYFFQMWGIQYTSASNAGFITGLNVVLVPVFSMLFYGDHPKSFFIRCNVCYHWTLFSFRRGLCIFNKG